jgi:hypothetical protein
MYFVDMEGYWTTAEGDGAASELSGLSHAVVM